MTTFDEVLLVAFIFFRAITSFILLDPSVNFKLCTLRYSCKWCTAAVLSLMYLMKNLYQMSFLKQNDFSTPATQAFSNPTLIFFIFFFFLYHHTDLTSFFYYSLSLRLVSLCPGGYTTKFYKGRRGPEVRPFTL